MAVSRQRLKHIAVILPAGGRGARMGSAHPKQFLPLRRVPIIIRTIKVFAALPMVQEIVVPAPEEYRQRLESLLRRYRLHTLVRVVVGGNDRQASVASGLKALRSGAKVVLIHDAVRPLVDPDLIERVARQADRFGGAAAAIRARDTILWEGSRGRFTRSLDRARLWTVQTPQGFKRDLLQKAHQRAERAGFRGTDEASLLLRIGRPVKIVESSPQNIKITFPEDLRIAGLFLVSRKPRKRL